ncbi:calcium uniporter protein 2, mitochondrial-like [Iris pallida]|uniref:Calcium uniporter protein 2, mitochondrial-like n=1 Tax=Iris pallida TaxID=29817 RepID=A0AAX6F4T6_IRIPA|nr:calcium uniporter protein 2, mitochondrial-like [Iris pallida]
MAFRKTLADRFLHVARTWSGSHLRSNPARKALPEPNIRRSFAQSSSSAAVAAGGLSSAGNSLLLDRIRILNPDRIRLDGILNPNPNPNPNLNRMSAAEVRKVLRAAQVEAARARLRATGRHCVPYEDFLGICREVSSSEQGSEIARSLDESGTVVVLGNLVFLRPDQIAKVIQSVIPLSLPQQDDGREELREMEEKKAAIDKQAEAGVRRELWGGLGFLVVQTVGFMRLTFWELSWDVMEPICFYVTSIYFMAGYSFFLRTSREPSFEGFFQSRFAAKQKRLMKAYDFDLSRFNQLKSACVAPSSSPLHEIASSSSHCDCCRRDVQFCTAH